MKPVTISVCGVLANLLTVATASAQPQPAVGTVAEDDATSATAPDVTGGPEPAQNGNTVDVPPSEEIIVTAQLRSQSLQRVAAAVTAVTGDQLVKLGATNLTQVSQIAPALRITPLRNQATIFLRGVGQTLTTPNADPAVAVNINGVYVPTEMTGSAFFDLERIEVLPGPQGTLYGRNAAGGVVNIFTRRPGDTLAADAFFEYGNYNRVQAFAAVDIPVNETLALRFAGNLIRHDGYFNNGSDDQETTSARATALWKLTDRTTVTGIVTYSHDGGIGQQLQNVPPAGGRWRDLPFDPRIEGYFTDFDTTQASLQVNHEVSDTVLFTYLGGYNQLKAYQNTAAFPLVRARLINDQSVKSTTHEVRVNATIGHMESVFGLYYFWSKSDYLADIAPLPTIRSLNGPFTSRSEGYAAFGQITYSLSDALRLTGGLRYSHTLKDLEGTNTTIVTGGPTTVVPYAGRASDNRVDWRAGVEFDIAPRSMLYANVGTGFTPGGFSTTPIVTGQITAAPFEPVTLTAYTAGIKNRFGPMTLNLEGFYYDYKDYQVSARNPITAQNTVYNADKAEVYGVQLDGSLSLSPNDQLSFNGSYLHAVAKRLITPAGNFSGLTLPFASKWTANASYEHRFDLAGGDNLTALVNFAYASDRWAFYTHPAAGEIQGRTRTDATLTYNSPDRKWALAGWIRNIENNVITAGGISGAIPGPSVMFLEPPRTYGGRFSFHF